MSVGRFAAAALAGAAAMLLIYGDGQDRGGADAQGRKEEQEAGGQAAHEGFLEDRARDRSVQAQIDSCQG